MCRKSAQGQHFTHINLVLSQEAETVVTSSMWDDFDVPGLEDGAVWLSQLSIGCYHCYRYKLFDVKNMECFNIHKQWQL